MEVMTQLQYVDNALYYMKGKKNSPIYRYDNSTRMFVQITNINDLEYPEESLMYRLSSTTIEDEPEQGQ